MGTRGSHFKKVNEAPTAGGAAEALHFARDGELGCARCFVFPLYDTFGFWFVAGPL